MYMGAGKDCIVCFHTHFSEFILNLLDIPAEKTNQVKRYQTKPGFSVLEYNRTRIEWVMHPNAQAIIAQACKVYRHLGSDYALCRAGS
jgi:hypothetical protein